MAYLTRKQVVLAMTEVAYGADPGPDPAVNAILCGIPTIRWAGDAMERDTVKADLSPMQHLVGIRHCEIEIPTEFKPSGALGNPPEIGPLLRACGLYETITPGASVRYDPISDAISSVCMWHHIGNDPDGIYTRILGGRGDFTLSIPGGAWGTCTFRMQGLYLGPTAFAMPVATYNATLPTQFLEVGASLGLYTPPISKFDLSMNNTISRKLDVTTTHGVGEVWIVNRRPTGNIDPEIVGTGTKDYWTEWLGMTEQALEVRWGTVGGNRITIHIPKAQYLSSPSPADADGLLRGSLDFKCNRTAGNDEFYILFD